MGNRETEKGVTKILAGASLVAPDMEKAEEKETVLAENLNWGV